MSFSCGEDEKVAHEESKHWSIFWQICWTSIEGSKEDIPESTSLASSSPPEIHSKIGSSLDMRDIISLAPAILS